MEEKEHGDWVSHIVTLVTALTALVLLMLTPAWAIRYYHQPFLGVLLEPNNVVSIIRGDNWPDAGVGGRWPNRLVAINGQPVWNVAQVNAILRQNGFEPVEVVFENPETRDYWVVSILPIHMPLWDFVNLFVVPYLVGVVFLVIGLWAYRLRWNSRAGRALLVMAGAVSIAASAFFDMNTTHHAVLLWTASLPMAAGALLHLALVFPKQMRLIERVPVLRFISWVLTLAFGIPALYEIVYPTALLRYITTWQACYFFMALAIAVFLGALLWRLFRNDSPIIRQQSRVIIFGAAVAFLPMMLFYLLPTALIEPQEFQPAIYFPLLIVFPLSIAYAVLRYRLLDVDRLLANLLSYLLTTAAAILVFFGLVTSISLLINQTVHADHPLVVALYVLALVIGLTPLQRLIQRLIDRFFYRSPADYRRIMNTISSRLVLTPNLENILDLLKDQLSQAFLPERFVIYLYDDERAIYVPHEQNENTFPHCLLHDPLVRLMQSAGKPQYFPEDATLPGGLNESATFTKINCAVFVPLPYEGALIGFMALGRKQSGEPYNSDDLDFLNMIASQSSLALENARLFINLRRTLDNTLEMKNLMDDIFASISTGIITTDIEHKITLFNRAAEKILGLSYQDVVGKQLPEAIPYCPDLDVVAAEAVERGSVVLSREVSPRIPPRGELYLRLSCSPVRDAYFATKGAAIVLEDLTERRKLQAEQERIRQTFGRVVAPRVRDRLLSDPSHLRLDGTRQPATILFADISGFTAFSEKTDPEVLFKVLNHYLSLAAQAILEEEGTLDKFWGDGVLAIWNAPDPQPDHALRAVRAACNIMKRTRQAHHLFSDPLHHLRFHIGIATGDVMVGNVGTNELFNYTAIGDTVNVAQRLETIAGPEEIMIDSNTQAVVAEAIYAEKLKPVMVKGRVQPVQVYRVRGLK